MKKVMGIGTAYLMAAELVFILSSYLIHIGIARYLGIELYGIFGVLMSLYLINRAFLNTGIPRAVSKFISESKHNLKSIFNTSFKLQLIFSLIFALLFIIFAKPIASILKDLSLTYYIMFLGVMIIPLSISVLYQDGYLNGLRSFKKQAILKIIDPILRLLLTFLFVFLGFKIFGVLFAYFITLIVVIIIARSFLRVKNNSTKFSARKLIKFAIPITIFALALSLVRNMNVLFLKSMLEDNLATGFYTSAATLSNIPYLVLSVLSVTLMPSISRSVASNNIILTRKYISRSLRYMVLLLLPITLVIAATSKELITLFYSSAYAPAASVLTVLIASSAFLVTFKTLSSIITGSGKPKIIMSIALISLVIIITLNIFLIPSLGIMGAAIASLITSFLAFMASAIYVYSKFNTLINLKSFLKILISSLIIFSIASYLHYSGILLLVTYAILGAVYFTLLLLLKEIKEEDINLIRKLFKQKHQ